MKKLIITLFVAVLSTMAMSAIEIDTLWYRTMGAGAQAVDFTPNDKYVIAWTNAIEFWEVQQGVREYSIPIDAKSVGDYNYNRQYLVFAKDSTPKLLDWQTKEVVEGFAKEDTFLGRIKTAKSKNEFMANTFHEDEDFGDIIGNTIYFYNIDNKTKVDSISFVKQFERENVKWKNTVLDYDYCGNNDELIYVYMLEANNELQQLPQVWWKRNFYVNFYNRETKELVDSVLVFDEYNNHYGVINKMQVMNDRSKIAWNNSGGVINFFDVYTKKFYDWLVFDSHDYAEVNDIDYTDNENIIGIASNLNLQIIKSKNEILKKLDYAVEHISFPKDSDFFVISGGSFIAFYKKSWLETNVPNRDNNNLMITPNPVSNSINISYSFDNPTNYKFTLYDLTGNQINIIDEGFSANLNYSTDYNISYLPKGTYFIKLIYGSQSISQKFIKE